jgi:hypothetical protein
MAYELGAMTDSPADLDYSQASLADAFYSGVDFDTYEGQALLNGKKAWRKWAGAPEKRMQRQAYAASHLAGRRFHRWGWCIKMLGGGQAGFKRCQALASLEPKKRVAAIRKMRAAAIASFQQMKAQHEAQTAAITPAPTAGEFGLPSTTPTTGAEFVAPAAGVVASAPAAPGGAAGAGGELGAFLFQS